LINCILSHWLDNIYNAYTHNVHVNIILDICSVSCLCDVPVSYHSYHYISLKSSRRCVAGFSTWYFWHRLRRAFDRAEAYWLSESIRLWRVGVASGGTSSKGSSKRSKGPLNVSPFIVGRIYHRSPKVYSCAHGLLLSTTTTTAATACWSD